MYSSVKFLSPITTGGLPTPGPLEAAVGDPLTGPAGVAGAAVFVVELLFDELPHAASATASTTARTVARALLCFTSTSSFG